MRTNTHSDFIFSPITEVLKDAVTASSGIGNGIETFPLYDYVMQSTFLKATGFQEQKMKCICWEIATFDYEYRYEFTKTPLGECSSYSGNTAQSRGGVLHATTEGQIKVLQAMITGNGLQDHGLVAHASVDGSVEIEGSMIVKNGGENHPNAKVKFKLGDVVTTVLKTSNEESIIISHDTNLPRPYSLGFRVQGTKGLWMDVNKSIYVEGKSPSHRWESQDKYMEE